MTLHSHWPLKSQHYFLQAILAHWGVWLVMLPKWERVELNDWVLTGPGRVNYCRLQEAMGLTINGRASPTVLIWMSVGGRILPVVRLNCGSSRWKGTTLNGLIWFSLVHTFMAPVGKSSVTHTGMHTCAHTHTHTCTLHTHTHKALGQDGFPRPQSWTLMDTITI